MKKILFAIIGLSLLMAAVSFARPWGPGTPGAISAEQQKFFDESRELRREMHDKRFELMELYRSSADQAKIDAIEKEIEDLRTKIQSKAADMGISKGPGSCREQFSNCDMGRGCGKGMSACNGSGPCADQVARGCGNRAGRCAQ